MPPGALRRGPSRCLLHGAARERVARCDVSVSCTAREKKRKKERREREKEKEREKGRDVLRGVLRRDVLRSIARRDVVLSVLRGAAHPKQSAAVQKVRQSVHGVLRSCAAADSGCVHCSSMHACITPCNTSVCYKGVTDGLQGCNGRALAAG